MTPPREPTGKQRAIQREREETPEEQEAIKVSFPPRSRYAWPMLMLVLGGGGAGAGSFAYHRVLPDGPSAEVSAKVDAALARVGKLEETTRTLELHDERFSTKLDDIKDDLNEIKGALNDLRRRGR